MTTLNELNNLRTEKGLKPLKVWKASKTALLAAIAKLTGSTPAVEKADDVIGTPEFDFTPPAAKPAAKKAVKKTDKRQNPSAKVAHKATKAKKVAAKKSSGDGISISTIAAELDIDPKVARAKMRRHFGKKEQGKWPSSIAEIKKVLSVDSRKKS